MTRTTRYYWSAATMERTETRDGQEIGGIRVPVSEMRILVNRCGHCIPSRERHWMRDAVTAAAKATTGVAVGWQSLS